MNHPPLVSSQLTPSHCAHLRHKGMYVTQDDSSGLLASYRDWIEATAYWCGCTQKAFGPDGRPVTAEACRGGRGCCEH
ncbi:MAG TPA: hypothetical protein VFX12_09360 [Vicinamibacterales bacterium]|nr:hypothetical protein [Vicinamibacterales bacterium]